VRVWNVEASALYTQLMYTQFSFLLDVFTPMKREKEHRNCQYASNENLNHEGRSLLVEANHLPVSNVFFLH
jgi:hypothetical protein